MGKIILITGGARSGKSSFALRKAQESEFNNKKVFIATAMASDSEMVKRIQKHRDERDVKWETIEEPVALERLIATLTAKSVYCLDCLTVWLGNVWFTCGSDDEVLINHCRSLATALTKWKDTVLGEMLIVTNEVGSGIVPESPEVRLYRDMAGVLNQMVGALADEIFLTVCGAAVRIK